MSKRSVFKTLEEAVEYLYSEEIEADILALPPDVDELTDEEVLDDEDTGLPIVSDIAGFAEVQTHELEESDEEDHIPLAHLVPAKKKLKKEVPKKLVANWSKTDPVYEPFHPQNDYLAKEENLKTCLNQQSAVDMFEQFFDNEIYETIVQETVKYAVTQKNKHGFLVTKDEIKILIGFLIYSGYHTLPSERDYWSDDDDLGQTIVKNAMSRNAYRELKSVIHFQDNTKAQDNKNDRCFKIRPLLDRVNENFRKFGIFQENLSVDEMIVRYYGHHSLKQFIRAKPIRFGYKLWAMCGEDGYCYCFSLYTGKETQQLSDPLGTRVVLKMLSIVENPKSHCVYFDNFFTSHELLHRLREMQFRATGTIRENRTAKCPVQATKELEKLPRGSYDYRFDNKNKILLVKWNDNKCVSMATNFDTINPEASVARWSKEQKGKVLVAQPKVIYNYNQYMGGVDHHDWLLEKHSIAIRGKNGIGVCSPGSLTWLLLTLF